jgi:hypothetical protein
MDMSTKEFLDRLIKIAGLAAIIVLILSKILGPGPASKPATPTPQSIATVTPDDTFSNTGTSETCGDMLVLSLTNITVNRLAHDFPLDAGRLQALVLLTDGSSITQFNYHHDPVWIESGSEVKLGRFHSAIELGSGRPVYGWIMIMDSDHPSPEASVIGDIAGEIVGLGVEEAIGAAIKDDAKSAVPGNIAGSIADILIEQGIDWLARPDILGDIAFELREEAGWNVGTYHYALADGAVEVDFLVRRYNECQQFLAAADGTPPGYDFAPAGFSLQPARTQCLSGAPVTRLNVGAMAIVTVREGHHLFFREGPTQESSGIRYVNGHLVRVVEGPECDGQIMFWKVMDRWGRLGWMAESLTFGDPPMGTYYLFPMGVADPA